MIYPTSPSGFYSPGCLDTAPIPRRVDFRFGAWVSFGWNTYTLVLCPRNRNPSEKEWVPRVWGAVASLKTEPLEISLVVWPSMAIDVSLCSFCGFRGLRTFAMSVIHFLTLLNHEQTRLKPVESESMFQQTDMNKHLLALNLTGVPAKTFSSHGAFWWVQGNV